MSLFESRVLVALSVLVAAGLAPAAPQGTGCTYTVTHNGPTWNAQAMRVSPDVIAMAWARDGAYGGTGRSSAKGFQTGGAAVAVASVTYWFRVTHNAVADCLPVEFESDATLSAGVSTSIHGDRQDYALATGFQAANGVALPPISMAVAATNAGTPVQNATVSVSFGFINFSLTIPGVSVTGDTVDLDRRTVSTGGKRRIEEELITINCWTKIKVVTNGPFGGVAAARVDHSSVQAATLSICGVHNVEGRVTHEASEE
jgi:hypothetical protein